jgi:hypothetical protein
LVTRSGEGAWAVHEDVVAAAASIGGHGACGRLFWPGGFGTSTFDCRGFLGGIEGLAGGKLDCKRDWGGCRGRGRRLRRGVLGVGVGVPASAFALANWAYVVVVFVLSRPELHHGIGMRRRHWDSRLLGAGCIQKTQVSEEAKGQGIIRRMGCTYCVSRSKLARKISTRSEWKRVLTALTILEHVFL